MDQNSAQAPFNIDYPPMREPNLNRTDKPTSFALSPNAREFVPQNKQTQQQQRQPINNCLITQSMDKLNLNSSSTSAAPIGSPLQQQQQQYRQHFNHQYQHHPQNPHFSRPILSSSSTTSVQNRLGNLSQQQLHQSRQYNMQPQKIQQLQQQNASAFRNKQSSSSPLQNRLISSHVHNNIEQKQNQQHQPFYHNNYSTQDSSSSVTNNCETSQKKRSEQIEDETFALTYIEEIVEYLSSDPGLFDSISSRVLNVFRSFADNKYVLSNAMEIIFNQSIEEQNFRYMGAKLYGVLDSINTKNDSVFRNLLSLKLNYHQNEIQKFMQNENAKVRGTTLFLAELYMQLRNNGSRMTEIAQNIIFTMNQLLQKHTPENIKCICLTLKLAGYDLEADCSTDLLNIIERLHQVKIDVSTNRLLEATLALHKNNWGRNETINNQPITYTNNTMRFSNEPVFYGPDGQVLTEEENSFLEANIPSDIINEEDPDFDDYESEAGMDAEMEKDYNEFLKNTINNHSC